MRSIGLQFGSDSLRCVYLTSANDIETYLGRHTQKKLFGLDIETAKKQLEHELPKRSPQPGLDPRLSTIRLIQLYDADHNATYVLDLVKAKPHRIILQEFFDRKNLKFVAHNALFELKHLYYNYQVSPKIYCSMIGASIVDRAEHSPFETFDDEDSEGYRLEGEFKDDAEEKTSGNYKYKKLKGYSLDACIRRLYGIYIEKQLQTSDWNKKDLADEQIAYAALDAFLTYKILNTLKPKILEYKMRDAYKLSIRTQYAVRDMELNGVNVDWSKHTKLMEEWKNDTEGRKRELARYFGGVNTRSSKQLGEWLEKRFKDKPRIIETWPKTKSANRAAPSFGKSALTKYKEAYPEIKALLDSRKAEKLLSTYGANLAQAKHPYTKRIHCSFSISDTRTGRLSSRNPNLQNMPRDSAIRSIFTATNERCLIVADYSQIELRVAAELSRDPIMLRAFREGIDLHALIVSKLLKKPLNKVTKEERQQGKAVNFGFLFGMGAEKLDEYAEMSYGVKLGPEKCMKAYMLFHEILYAKYSSWCKVQRGDVTRLGFVRTPLGQVRKLLEDEIYTKAVNNPVQGGAAEVMKLALIKIAKLTTDKVSLVNCVHDEIILEADKKVAKSAAKALQSVMIDAMLEVFPDAPTDNLVECKIGNSWAECK